MLKHLSWIMAGILVVATAAYYALHFPDAQMVHDGVLATDTTSSVPSTLQSSSKSTKDRGLSSDPRRVVDQRQLIAQDMSHLKQVMKDGDSEKLQDLVNKLKQMGTPVIEYIREDLTEISWTNMSQRRDYFHILGFLKNDQAIPLIEDEIQKEDQSIAVDAYKERLGVAVADEVLVEDLLHHGTDVLPDASGGLTVTYTTSKIAAIQALGMMNSVASKGTLFKLVVNDDGQPTTQIAVQTYVAIATPEERRGLLKQVSKDQLKRYLSKKDMQKYYPN